MKTTNEIKTKEEKKYIVVWHFCANCANYGHDEITATSPQEAIKNHLFYGRKDIELIAFENNKKTSAYKAKEED